MPPKFGGAEKCGICDKSVYIQEKIEAGGVPFHKNCFKCSHCKKNLTLQNYAQAEKVLYCKTHYQSEVLGKNAQITT